MSKIAQRRTQDKTNEVSTVRNWLILSLTIKYQGTL